jgi:tetratricopeptide (TPR) repeat protein
MDPLQTTESNEAAQQLQQHSRRTVSSADRQPLLGTHNNDSFSDERFISTTPFMSALHSWESQSFDSEEPSRSISRPSSTMGIRRKQQFDATTPTLIDEEEEEEDGEPEEEEEEMKAFQKANTLLQHGATTGLPVDCNDNEIANADSSMRRTPGASMYKSQTFLDKTDLYAWALSAPAVDTDATDELKGTWESLTPTTNLQSQLHVNDESVLQTKETNDVFSFQPWNKEANPVARTYLSPTPIERQGAFSPGLMRLTTDIGNLLQEDEDDTFTLDMPTVFRPEKYDNMASEMTADWTIGSFSVTKNSNYRGKKHQHRVAGALPSGTRRPRVVDNVSVGVVDNMSVGGQGNFFINAQQPTPRRTGEVFEFGKQPHVDQRTSPQLLNFGGAFAPPAKDYTGSFSRPVAFSAPPETFPGAMLPRQGLQQLPTPAQRQFSSFPPLVRPHSSSSGPQPSSQQQTMLTHLGQQHGALIPPQRHRLVQQEFFGIQGSSPSPQPSYSFDTYKDDRETPIDAYFQPYRLASPSPTNPLPSQHAIRRSDMLATAQEFVPMSTRSMTPQYSRPTRLSNPSPLSYEAQLDMQRSWRSSPGSGFGRGQGHGFQSPSPDMRSATTPSPRFLWHQSDPGNNGAVGLQHSLHHIDSTVAHSAGAVSSPEQVRKRDTKRGKQRGKKKLPIKCDSSIPATGRKSAPPTGKIYTKERDPLRPVSTTAQGEEHLSVPDEPVDSRQVELDESPAVRMAFKNFYKAYRSEEQYGIDRAAAFATNALEDGSLPESVHWRVYIELADLARRTNCFSEARWFYQKVCKLQPYASQGWVEYSKLEEECGLMNRVANILHAGLEYCKFNESLLIRTIKHQERMGNFDKVRALLSRLKHVGVEKVWRTVLEGALFEARVGNILMARRVLKYIMRYVPWYGPLYVEFYRLERDYGHPLDALDVIERGLAQIPRYSPLWFSALRVCDELDHADQNFSLPRTTAMLCRASSHVSKEIAWKIYLEAAFLFERAGIERAGSDPKTLASFLMPARYYYALTIRTCRLNLRWKVWLAAARMELCAGNTDQAKKLFLRAHLVAPEKARSLTFLDYARLHEYIGERRTARAILCKGRLDYGHDWKVWLESVLLEIRCFNLLEGYDLASSAVTIHQGTGRLWSALVQLSQYTGGFDTQYTALQRALNAVPKSGEVWCEGARIHLNPFSNVFDVDRARRHLFFAEKFTPQYGDSFLEAIRVELINQCLGPIAEYIWQETKESFTRPTSSDRACGLTKYITDISLAISVARQPCADTASMLRPEHIGIVSAVRKRLSADAFKETVDLTSIIVLCSNADPNYGPLWFHCRQLQSDPPRKVVEYAAACMIRDLKDYGHVYLAAMIRRRAILSTVEHERPEINEGAVEIFDPVVMAWENRVDELLRSFSSLREIYNPIDPTTGLVLLETTINGSNFVTGMMHFNIYRPIEQMSLSDRKRTIFATDALFQ